MDAIEIIEESIETHWQWAKYFEKYPTVESHSKYKHIGSAKFHRECIANYKQAIKQIEQLQAENKDYEKVCKDKDEHIENLEKENAYYINVYYILYKCMDEVKESDLIPTGGAWYDKIKQALKKDEADLCGGLAKGDPKSI